jgi:hypothetical protein
MTKAEERSDRTHLSLNEAERRAERQQDDDWRLALENTLRAATGKPVAETLDELEDMQKAEEDDLTTDTAQTDTQTDPNAVAEQAVVAGQDVIEEIDDDPLLREAGRIVSDLIDLVSQPTSSAPLTAKAPTVSEQPRKATPAG